MTTQGQENLRAQNSDEKSEFHQPCREVDAIPQIVHHLQTDKENPQFGLDCVEDIFNCTIDRPVGGTEYVPVTRVQQRI